MHSHDLSGAILFQSGKQPALNICMLRVSKVHQPIITTKLNEHLPQCWSSYVNDLTFCNWPYPLFSTGHVKDTVYATSITKSKRVETVYCCYCCFWTSSNTDMFMAVHVKQEIYYCLNIYHFTWGFHLNYWRKWIQSFPTYGYLTNLSVFILSTYSLNIMFQ